MKDCLCCSPQEMRTLCEGLDMQNVYAEVVCRMCFTIMHACCTNVCADVMWLHRCLLPLGIWTAIGHKIETPPKKGRQRCV